VLTFFADEVPATFLSKVNECFAELGRDESKLSLFEEKKKLNQLEYDCSQKFSLCSEFCCTNAAMINETQFRDFLVPDQNYSWVTTEIPDVPLSTWFLLSGA
jgi:hypothetical protein